MLCSANHFSSRGVPYPRGAPSMSTAARPAPRRAARSDESARLRRDASAPGDAEPDAEACASSFVAVVPGVMDALRASMRRNIGDALSVPQFRCLGYIARSPRCSVSEVAAFLGVTLPTASAMVDRLVRAGHVLSSTARADRRRMELRLNAPGKALLDRIRTAAHRDIAGALSGASRDELAAVHRAFEVLQRLFANDRIPDVGGTL